VDSPEIVERGTILRATVGSTVHGLHHGGQNDRDEMAVFVEPPEYLLGLARARGIRGGLYGLEHYVERTQPEGVRSGPGDLDLVAYSLRKYVRLAPKGHPTVFLLLFVPDELTLVETQLGRRLRQLRPAILSKRAGRGYLGYLRGQKERLLGTRGQKRVNRPELVEAHGFDTKYAMHAARLGYQGLELLETGRLPLPMAEPERSRVMAIRAGERTFEETIAEIEEVEQRLSEALERTPLPPEPERAAAGRAGDPSGSAARPVQIEDLPPRPGRIRCVPGPRRTVLALAAAAAFVVAPGAPGAVSCASRAPARA